MVSASSAASIPSVTLRGCDKPMPVIGMGTSSYPLPEHELIKTAILEAIKVGYRHFDTAFAYGSEKPLGDAIAEALRLGLVSSRDDLFITTKLWASFADPSQIVQACRMSLQNLGLEYVDMYLIHVPVRLTEMVKTRPIPMELIKPMDFEAVWPAMEDCKNLGLTKGIGVSNFSRRMIDQILSVAKIPPALNQVEVNTNWQQTELREFCKAKGVHVVAYSALGANNTMWGNNRVISNDVLGDIAKARGKTVAQVALRWVYEQGTSVVAKSFNKERMEENLGIFDWCLSADDLEKISQLPSQGKLVTLESIFGPHPMILELDAEV